MQRPVPASWCSRSHGHQQVQVKSVCRWMGCWGRLQSQVLSEYACVQKAGDKFNGRHPRWRAKSQGNTDLNVSGNLRVLLANCVQYEPGWEGEDTCAGREARGWWPRSAFLKGAGHLFGVLFHVQSMRRVPVNNVLLALAVPGRQCVYSEAENVFPVRGMLLPDPPGPAV